MSGSRSCRSPSPARTSSISRAAGPGSPCQRSPGCSAPRRTPAAEPDSVRAPPAPEPLPAYSTEWVLRIPRPAPFRNRRCMPPRRLWWRDALRQLAPRYSGRDCCWMHQGDWHRVSRTAITLVRQAQRDGIAGEDICGHVLAQARADGVTGWQLDALECPRELLRRNPARHRRGRPPVLHQRPAQDTRHARPRRPAYHDRAVAVAASRDVPTEPR